MTDNLKAAKAELSHLELEDNPKLTRIASRDSFWYSPVLKPRLDHVLGDFVVSPRTEEEIIEVMQVCYKHDIPVTTRGAGTGNYGQAMPLSGGCIMHLKHMNKVKSVAPGQVVVEPGCILKDLDAFCIEHSGQELRMFSSTWSTATIGGFIAGGSGGVGSVTWGSLRDLGNIIRLRVITMEEQPQILTFSGEDIARVSHAYGTNGIISELTMPLAPAYEWVDLFVKSTNFTDAMNFADELANKDGLLIKLASVYEAPTAHDYFSRLKTHVQAEDHLVGLMVAPHSLEGVLTLLQQYSTLEVIYRSDSHDWQTHPGRIFEYGWNHTTLRALKVDSKITYLQVRYGYPEHKELVRQMRDTFAGEVIQHLEVIRMDGKVGFAGLSLVRFTTEERLDEIIRIHEEAGALIFNPHRYTLEEGGRQHSDDTQLSFKKEADPKGLLNPGKMIAWDRPDWDYQKIYDYHEDGKSVPQSQEREMVSSD